MSQGIARRMAVLAGALALAACSVGAPPKPAPKPAPEPAQATPSAEARQPVRVVDANCEEIPRNGTVLEGAIGDEGANSYQINNETDFRAVVKIRRGMGGPLVAAVYVAPHSMVSIGPLPDGTYHTSFAMGRDFAADCRQLDTPTGYGQSEHADTFTSKDVNGETTGRTQTYGFEDGDIDGGDGAQALTAEKFNAP